MSTIGRQIKFRKPFGPYIVQTTISDELHKILLDTALKIRKNKKLNKKQDYRNKLAGNLKEEYSYENMFTAKQKQIVHEEFLWLASCYTKTARQAIDKNEDREPYELKLHEPIWVNFMKAGEWNPSHAHSGDISCVTYLKIPKEIEEENETAEHTSKSNTPSAGRIEFIYGDNIKYCVTGIFQKPKEKDIYLFPAKLRHQVYPFKSKVERISVSVNFGDIIDAHRNLQISKR